MSRLRRYRDKCSWCCAGGIIGPYLIGALSDKYSYGAAMITLGAFNLLAALLFTTFPGAAATPRKLHLHLADVPRGVLVCNHSLLHIGLHLGHPKLRRLLTGAVLPAERDVDSAAAVNTASHRCARSQDKDVCMAVLAQIC